MYRIRISYFHHVHDLPFTGESYCFCNKFLHYNKSIYLLCFLKFKNYKQKRQLKIRVQYLVETRIQNNTLNTMHKLWIKNQRNIFLEINNLA